MFDPTPNIFEDVLRDYCDENSPPDEILVLSPASEADSIRAATGSDEFLSRLPGITRHLDTPPVRLILFDARGKTDDEAVMTHIRRMGMTQIFDSRGGMMESSTSHHFQKPSGGHCDRFLRAGNVVVDGAETDFIAFCVLGALPEETRHIYCDTGTINAVAYAAIALRTRLNADCEKVSVDSFGSYDGLKKFRFRNLQESFVLISASTSGGLSIDIKSVEPSIEDSRIATLYYLGEKRGHGSILCDLARDVTENPNGFGGIQTEASQSCQLCSNGSSPIPIFGDYFLPDGPAVDAVILRISHAPAWLSPFLERMRGFGTIRANYKVGAASAAAKDVFLDVETLFTDSIAQKIPRLARRFNRSILHAVSNQTIRFLHLDDAGSKQLANEVRVAAGYGDDFPVVPLREVRAKLVENTRDSGVTIVVAGAVASGSSLLAASQVLRRIQSNGAINYLIGISRTPDKAMLDELQSNVTFGDLPNEHGFHVMDSVHLPLHRSARETPWDNEKNLLLELAELEIKPEAHAFVESRIAVLAESQSPEIRGLVSNLFLPQHEGPELFLREGFAFLNFDYPERSITQSEVFFVVSAVLHGARRHRVAKDSLRQRSNSRKLISPRCFERFNDGVIQAAMLRAATSTELDYSISVEVSEQMERILGFVFANATDPVGEAAREFLLALAMKKLRLATPALQRLSENFSKNEDDPFSYALWALLNQQHGFGPVP